MYRYFIEMSYDGTAYHGWQVQPNATSVQQTFDDAMCKALRRNVYIIGAGRTDTGVHARYYVAHFETDDVVEDLDFLKYKLNVILPPDISVKSIQPVDKTLHSRFSAISRVYKYNISLSKDPFARAYSYKPNFELDFEKMNQAAELLLHYTDFTSFSRLHTDTKTNDCNVTLAVWQKISDNDWVFTIAANRFLRNMVRAIVGTLMDVGRNKISIDDFVRIIEQKDRCKAGSSAPGHALALVDIEYPKGFGFVPIARLSI